MNASQKTVLVVEDSEDDVRLLDRSIKAVGLTNPIRYVDSVERAIEYLKGDGEFSDRQRHPMAALVLLDMKITPHDGLDVLRWVRSQSTMRDVIVVATSSSENPMLKDKADRLGANAFSVKPLGTEARNEMVKNLHQLLLTADSDTPKG
jgi:CheY-like chemotaxis protein